ncbi:carbohydrate kinase family protein [Candidatus Woesearchaeota archaeon]|nr:carbohydrate kinase family protein [Candidatus Woesearchaeota archaeon]
MFDIITVGSATVDVFANTASSLVKIVTKDGEEDLIAYPSGSKIVVSELNFHIGGGGTNTAYLFSTMGCQTAFLGKLGNDDNAEKVLQLLTHANITFIGVQEGKTGYSIILDSIEHDRTILTFKGSNNLLLPTEIPYEKLNATWLYSSSMVEQSFATLKQLFVVAKERGMKTAFNPSDYQAKLGLRALQDIIDYCDVLVLNLEEAQLLLGKKGDALLLSKALGSYGLEYVLITDGSRGATCYHKGTHYTLHSSPTVTVVETTGAGDAFAAGFISGLFYEQSVEFSLKLAMVQAESVIGAHGAKETILSKQEAFNRAEHFQGTFSKQELVGTNNVVLDETVPQFHIATVSQQFKCNNGKQIASVEGLGYYLPVMPDEVFFYHVTNERNDFANWLKDVFHQNTLARLINECHDKQVMSELLLDYLHKKVGEISEN